MVELSDELLGNRKKDKPNDQQRRTKCEEAECFWTFSSISNPTIEIKRRHKQSLRRLGQVLPHQGYAQGYKNKHNKHQPQHL